MFGCSCKHFSICTSTGTQRELIDFRCSPMFFSTLIIISFWVFVSTTIDHGVKSKEIPIQSFNELYGINVPLYGLFLLLVLFDKNKSFYGKYKRVAQKDFEHCIYRLVKMNDCIRVYIKKGYS